MWYHVSEKPPWSTQSTEQDTPQHGYIRLLLLSKIIRRSVRVTLFCDNARIIWDRHQLKVALKPSVSIWPTLQRVC